MARSGIGQILYNILAAGAKKIARFPNYSGFLAF
jgi:hypothetical protein